MFGEERKGVHSFRLFDVAVVDLFLTLLAAYYIAKYTKNDFWIVSTILLIVGVVMHRLFCVKTKFDYIIFGN
jgi:hypothetical protein